MMQECFLVHTVTVYDIVANLHQKGNRKITALFVPLQFVKSPESL